MEPGEDSEEQKKNYCEDKFPPRFSAGGKAGRVKGRLEYVGRLMMWLLPSFFYLVSSVTSTIYVRLEANVSRTGMSLRRQVSEITCGQGHTCRCRNA